MEKWKWSRSYQKGLQIRKETETRRQWYADGRQADLQGHWRSSSGVSEPPRWDWAASPISQSSIVYTEPAYKGKACDYTRARSSESQRSDTADAHTSGNTKG